MKNFKFLLVAVLVVSALTACAPNEKEKAAVTETETPESNSLDEEVKTDEAVGAQIAVSPDVVSGKLGDAVLAVKDALGDGYLPNAPIYLEQLGELYQVNPGDVKQFIAEVPMIGMHPDLFIAIEANEGAVESVQTALNTYKDYLINDSLQYPINLAKVKTTEVVTYGNYVFLVLLGAPNDNMDASDEEAAIFAAAEAQKALDALASVFTE